MKPKKNDTKMSERKFGQPELLIDMAIELIKKRTGGTSVDLAEALGYLGTAQNELKRQKLSETDERSAKEIVEEIKRGTPFSGGFDEWESEEMIKDFAKQKCEERLSELKEKAHALKKGRGFENYNAGIDSVLQLIEETCS